MNAQPTAENDAHLWGSVTQTLCGLDAFRVVGTHVEMTSGTILRVVDAPPDATCSGCLGAYHCEPCRNGSHWRCAEPGTCRCAEPVDTPTSPGSGDTEEPR